MRDLICVTKVIDAQAAGYFPGHVVAGHRWRSFRRPTPPYQRLSPVLPRGAPKATPVTLCHGVTDALCAGSGNRHASGTTGKA